MAVERLDVAVVGAGLCGAAAARELTGRGHSVLVLEQHEVGHDRGSSHGSSRIYRRAYTDPTYIALTGRADGEWERLEEESGVRLRTRTGGLDAGHRAQVIHDALLAHGLPATLLRADEVAERWPGIALDGPACFHPDAGHLDPDLTVSTLLDLATRSGAELREHTSMTRVEPVTDGLLVHTAAGPPPPGPGAGRARRRPQRRAVAAAPCRAGGAVRCRGLSCRGGGAAGEC